ncbi:MAG: hypothetical protein NEA02_04455 [Thermoanaerobaculia bacterium]|nr:hypothetical protein [Thermoanaerobaculia bacterium]
MREAAALQRTTPGGAGAVRELCDLLPEGRGGARADRPAAVEQPQEPGDGDVIPFPFGRN